MGQYNAGQLSPRQAGYLSVYLDSTLNSTLERFLLDSSVASEPWLRWDDEGGGGQPCGNSHISPDKTCHVGGGGSLAEKAKHFAIHEGDELGRNVTSWGVGKVVGGAVASFAIAHGAAPIATAIIAQSVTQATVATGLHAIQESRKGNELTPRKLGTYFASQVSGAYLGKYAHLGADYAMERFGGTLQQAAALVAGKVTGIGTVAGTQYAAKKLGLDSLDAIAGAMAYWRDAADEGWAPELPLELFTTADPDELAAVSEKHAEALWMAFLAGVAKALEQVGELPLPQGGQAQEKPQEKQDSFALDMASDREGLSPWALGYLSVHGAPSRPRSPSPAPSRNSRRDSRPVGRMDNGRPGGRPRSRRRRTRRDRGNPAGDGQPCGRSHISSAFECHVGAGEVGVSNWIDEASIQAAAKANHKTYESAATAIDQAVFQGNPVMQELSGKLAAAGIDPKPTMIDPAEFKDKGAFHANGSIHLGLALQVDEDLDSGTKVERFLRGSSSYIHEWGHFADQKIGEKLGVKSGYASDTLPLGDARTNPEERGRIADLLKVTDELLVDEFSDKVTSKNYEERVQSIVARDRLRGLFQDVAGCLTGGQVGGGHAVEYYNRGGGTKSRKELFTHIMTIRSLNMPEADAALKKMAPAAVAEFDKIWNNLGDRAKPAARAKASQPVRHAPAPPKRTAPKAPPQQPAPRRAPSPPKRSPATPSAPKASAPKPSPPPVRRAPAPPRRTPRTQTPAAKPPIRRAPPPPRRS